MTRDGTPVTYYPDYDLWVKHEEQCCPGGPNFSKTRGVFAHVKKRPEKFIGVLDTRHSAGGWAVARACKELGKQCVEFYPVLKGWNGELGAVQQECRKLGAQLLPLKAGRSAVLYHQAKKWLAGSPDLTFGHESYLMPNALKLPEMVSETAAEVERTKIPDVDVVLISASSGTIAAGLIQGLRKIGWQRRVVVHLGYTRPIGAVRSYLAKMSAIPFGGMGLVDIVDEEYAYSDEASPGPTPPFPSNVYYDLKAFRFWIKDGREKYGKALLWNVG
jgi:hypothetical protein